MIFNQMIFKQLFDPVSSTLTYVIGDADTREAVIIDPVAQQSARDLGAIDALNLKLKWILDTHVHADHVTGAAILKAATGAQAAVGMACDAPAYDRQLIGGDTIKFGAETIGVIATPGHTPGGLTFQWRDRLFTGDALLIGGCGRTDFQGGSAGQLYSSITGNVFTLPDETLVYPGHDYRGRRVSSVGEEKSLNPRFAGQTREQFIELMAGLNLPKPKLIDVAVPANKRAGESHAA